MNGFCLPCAKEIIDGQAALVRALDCMKNSILIDLSKETPTTPTQQMADEFRAAADNLATVAAKIEAYVGASLEKMQPSSPATWEPSTGGGKKTEGGAT